MPSIPMQLIVVELENGRRGVFFGAPLVGDHESEAECQVEGVHFSNVSELPENLGLAELSRIALAQFERGRRPWH